MIRHQTCEATRIRQVPSQASVEMTDSMTDILQHQTCEAERIMHVPSKASGEILRDPSKPGLQQDERCGEVMQLDETIAEVLREHCQEIRDFLNEWSQRSSPQRLPPRSRVNNRLADHQPTTTSPLEDRTGVFCQNAIENAEKDRDEVIQQQLHAKEQYSKDEASTLQNQVNSVDPWKSELVKGTLQAQKKLKKDINTRMKELNKAGSDMEHFFELRELNRRCELFWHRLVNHGVFESLTTVVILFNALALGLQADLDARGWEKQDPSLLNGFTILELLFTSYYCFECLARLMAYRCEYFTGAERSWNWFDFIVCIQAITEQIFKALSMPGLANGSFLRVLRVLKTVKLLRVVRLMKVFRELRLIVNSIVGSMRSMIWSLVLIAGCIYVFSVGIVQAFAAYKDDLDPEDLPEAAVIAYWGTMGDSMRSLYMASLGGIDWKECADPLHHLGAMWYMLFVMYIAFFFCVITNTLTSLFVDTTIRSSAKDQALIIQEELEKKDEFIHTLSEVFEHMDQDGDGHVSYGEFCRLADNPRLLAFAASLDIDASDTKHFFKILSQQGTVEVDLATFVVGCINLRGQAKAMDLYALGASQKEFFAACAQHLAVIEDRIGELAEHVYSNEFDLSAVSGASNMGNINGLIKATEL